MQNVRKIDPQAYHQARQRGGIPKLGGVAVDGKPGETAASKLPATQPSARANSGLDHHQLPSQHGAPQIDHQFQAAVGSSALHSQNAQSQQLEDENDAYNNHI